MIISLLNGLLPSFIAVPLYRMRGMKIGKGVKIRIGTFLLSKKVDIGDNCDIGPLVVIKTKQFTTGDHTKIRPLSFISTPIVELGRYIQISGPTIISSDNMPQAFFKAGDHTRVFPYCWLESGAGITIGKQVGVGGHTQIFTHGYWTNYLKRGPISFGPVVIEDEVYVAWRSFIMPNVTIGTRAIIAANTVVHKSVNAFSVVAGNPARALQQIDADPLSDEELATRVNEIFDAFIPYAVHRGFNTSRLNSSTLSCGSIKIGYTAADVPSANDLLITFEATASPALSERLSQAKNVIDLQTLQATIFNKQKEAALLIGFFRKYGIRLYVN